MGEQGITMPPETGEEPQDGFATDPALADATDQVLAAEAAVDGAEPIREGFTVSDEHMAAVRAEADAQRARSEQESLAKSYGDTILRIDAAEDGGYQVTLPGGTLEGGRLMGSHRVNTATWNEARDALLRTHENIAQLVHKPILEMQAAPGESIAFSRFEDFNPRVAPSKDAHPIPASVSGYLTHEDRLNPDASTYQETIKAPGWEKELFGIARSYFTHNAPEVLDELGIKSFDALTPKQAIELSSRIVIDLTKYKWGDTAEAKGDTAPGEKSYADTRGASQLLLNGLVNKDKPEWEGNGVCRNFASSVKAVFEAFKANQTQYSRLRDTYCLYDAGDEFAPRREDPSTTRLDATPGHAWNTFVTISQEGSAHATIVDVTWAENNLDTKQVEGLDHTLIRMEPLVHEVGKNMTANTPDRDAQLQNVLSYYARKIEDTSAIDEPLPPTEALDDAAKAHYRLVAAQHFSKDYDLSGLRDEVVISLGQNFERESGRPLAEREREYFTGRAVDVMVKQGVPSDLPDGLPVAIGRQYQNLGDKIDVGELGTIYRISEAHPELDFGSVLQSYLEGRRFSGNNGPEFIFRDDALQRHVYDELSQRPGFDEFIDGNPDFRVRIREVVPERFAGFAPGSVPADASELRYLAGRSHSLAGRTTAVDPRKPTEANVSRFLGQARSSLQSINPIAYEREVAEVGDYDMIKHYEALRRRLSADQAEQ